MFLQVWELSLFNKLIRKVKTSFRTISSILFIIQNQLDFSNIQRHFASLVLTWIIHTNHMVDHKNGMEIDQF